MKKILLFIISLALLLTFTSCKGGNKKPYETYTYGKYPQAKLSDKTIIDELNKLTDDAKNSDGYFVYEGKEYAKVLANPRYEYYPASDGSYIYRDKYYYFIVDKIIWRVLKKDNNIRYLISDNILYSVDYFTNLETTEYSYSTSNIRSFLINDFYNTAFSSETNKPLQTEIEIDTYNSKIKLNDSVWLPSVYDIDSKNNGFYSDDDRFTSSTDYATASGILLNVDSPNSYFYRCSPYATSTVVELEEKYIYYIDIYGKNDISNSRDILDKIGVRPCIRIETKN